MANTTIQTEETSRVIGSTKEAYNPNGDLYFLQSSNHPPIVVFSLNICPHHQGYVWNLDSIMEKKKKVGEKKDTNTNSFILLIIL